MCTVYKSLFELKKEQKEKDGEDGPVLEYDKPIFQVVMPPSKVVLPREKPAPKEKQLTKWEKFRVERGLAPRKKRSRMVYDPITKDFVPRHGMGSIKKIANKHQWLMEEKPKHTDAKTDPYTYAAAEKNLVKEK